MTVSIHKQTSCHHFILGLIELTLILEHTKKWSKLSQRRNEKNSGINEEINGHQDGSEDKGSNSNLDYLSSISGIPMVKGVKDPNRVSYDLYISAMAHVPHPVIKKQQQQKKAKQMNEEKAAAATLFQSEENSSKDRV